MRYVLKITREGEPILECEVNADDVVGLVLKHTKPASETLPVFETGDAQPDGGKRKYKKRKEKAEGGGRKCGACGKSGHTVRTCPSNKAENYGMESGGERQPASTRDPNRQPMSQDEFEDVLLKFKEEGNSRAVMDYFPDIPADEINLAIRVKNYRIYART